MNRMTKRFSNREMDEGAIIADRPTERDSAADGSPPSLRPPLDSAFGLADVWERARRATASDRSPTPSSPTPGLNARKVQFFFD
jgi:hypothetical protein